MRSTSTLPTILQQYCGSRPTSPVPFGIKMQSPSSLPSSSANEPDYFSSHLNTQDLLDSLPKLSKSSMVEGEQLELERIREGLLNKAHGKEGKPRRPSASYFRIVKNQGMDSISASGGSSLSTPSLESDYSLSASCSPLHTPLDDYEYSGPATPLDSNSPVLEASSSSSPPPSLASRRGRPMKIEIPPFQLDASYFTAPTKAAVAKPSSFQFDVAPPRRSKPASLPMKPSAPSSWSQDPVDLAGIIGERPGSPIRFKQKRRDNGFAF
ncbi:hypothetical protein JCM5353_002234 [Sporobolomyces roseus]